MKNLLTSFSLGTTPDAKLNLSVAIGSTVVRQILSSALYFVALWVTTRHLGPHRNGLLATTMLLPQTLYAFLNLGLGPSHVYHISSGAGSHDRMRHTNWLLAFLLWAVVALALAVSPDGSIAHYLPGIDKQSALYASLLLPAMLLGAWTSALIQGNRDYQAYNKTLLIQPLVFCCAVLLLGASGAISVVSVVSCYLVSQASLWLLCEARLRKVSRPVGSSRYTLLEAIKYGLRAHISNVITFMNYRIALYLVSYFLGPSATGTYTLSIQLAEVLWLVSSAASMIVFPESAAHHKSPVELKAMIEKIAASVVKVTLAAALIAAALSVFAIPWVFGRAYQAAVTPYVLLLPGIVAWSYMSVLSNSLAGMGFQKVNIHSALLCLSINVGGGLLVIPAFGLNGAALVSTLAFSGAALYTMLVYKKMMTRRLREHAAETKGQHP